MQESGPNLKVVEGGDLVVPSQAPFTHHLDLELERRLRKWTQYILLFLFAVTNVSTVLLFWAVALGKATLSNAALGELAGMTTAEVAGLLYVSTRYLFPDRGDAKSKKRK